MCACAIHRMHSGTVLHTTLAPTTPTSANADSTAVCCDAARELLVAEQARQSHIMNQNGACATSGFEMRCASGTFGTGGPSRPTPRIQHEFEEV